MSRVVCGTCGADDFGDRTKHRPECLAYDVERYVAAWAKSMREAGFSEDEIESWEKRVRRGLE